MKIIYLINKYALVTTLILYLTIILGLYAQVVLGAVQVLSALSIFFLWKKLNKNDKHNLLVYWTFVLTYGLCWWVEINLQQLWWVGIIVIPMSIAIYFVWILNNLKNY